jgi:hypothetical protein
MAVSPLPSTQSRSKYRCWIVGIFIHQRDAGEVYANRDPEARVDA